MHVDPHNGYLYWTLSDNIHYGLYRIDLAHLDDTFITYKQSQFILKDPSLTVFTIDYSNYRLYFPKSDGSNNTIISVSLDGDDEKDIRQDKVETSQFTNVHNIIAFNNSFYWTTGAVIYKEEYDGNMEKIYHNAFDGPIMYDDICVALIMFHPSVQPYPVPHNPAENIEAIFSDNKAKVIWNKPTLLGGTGLGAWQGWSYELQVEEVYSNKTTVRKSLNETHCALHELSPNTHYALQIRPYSKAGHGPWSGPFYGQTLKSVNRSSRYPFALWGTKNGLVKSDALGENIESLVHTMNIDKGLITGTIFKHSIFTLNLLSILI